MRKDDSYEEVSAALARRLGLDDPLKLRFTGQLGRGGGGGMRMMGCWLGDGCDGWRGTHGGSEAGCW